MIPRRHPARPHGCAAARAVQWDVLKSDSGTLMTPRVEYEITRKALGLGPMSNCVGGRSAIGRPQGWRGAPPPSGAHGLDPDRSPLFGIGMRSVFDRAR
jgi:hypothetical protein